jgi:hypothetical protein
MASEIVAPDPSLLAAYGLLPSIRAAIQIDVTAVLRRQGHELVETYLCDHNCTITHKGAPTGGHYNCPAALTLNRGAIAATIAGADALLHGIEQMLAAAQQAQRNFIDDGFEEYALAFALPDGIRDALRAALLDGPSEVTLFGGSPEAHPQIVPLVEGLRARGHSVHITMTGRRLIRHPELLGELVGSGVTVLALSADDVDSVAELDRLLEAEPEQLRAEWKKVPALHGQRQKVFEAIHAARQWQRLPADQRPSILFNIAVHPGNVVEIGQVLAALTQAFPEALLNPFPMQSAFEGRLADLTSERLGDFRALISQAIANQHSRAVGRPTSWGLVQRMHYWLLLAVVTDREDATARMTGWETWKCFRSAAAGRYVQVAGTGRRPTALQTAGGRVGCFWNDAINDDSVPAIWDASPQQLRTYLKLRSTIAARPGRGCAGCLFPRLVGDMVSLETGMDSALRDAYLLLRKQHLGF